MKPVSPAMNTLFRVLFVGLLVTAGVVTGCNSIGGPPVVRGSGVVVSETRDVAGFSDVRVDGSGDVIIEQTGTESLTVVADDNILPLLKTRVVDGVLHLGPARNVNIHTSKPVRYHVTTKQLNGVGVSGSGSIRATGIDADQFSADISGSGSANLSGRADSATLSVSGSGSYEAGNLRSKTVKVSISGSGDAVVDASDRLDAAISGSGSVRYSGSPSVNQRVSGSGSIARR
jgi:hypothetical protein